MMAYRYVLSMAAAVAVGACGLIVHKPPPSAFDERSTEDAGQGGNAAASADENDGVPRSLAMVKGSEDGARAFLEHFLDPQADVVQLSASMHPITRDLEAIFDAELGPRVESMLAKEWNTPQKLVIKPKKGQTEIKLWSATGTELAQGTGNAKDFPSEYQKIGPHLAPDRLFFRFKFTEPGKDTGVAYDVLTFVDDHWLLVPKPYRAVGIKDDDSAAPSGSKKKPKGKGKKK